MQKTHKSTFLCVVFGLMVIIHSAITGAQDPSSAENETATTDAPAAATNEDEAFLNEPGQGEPPVGVEEAGQEPPDQAEKKERLRDHDFQGFVNVLFGTGWYFVAPYDKDDENKRCGDWEDTSDPTEQAGPAICTGRSAWHFDFLGGFGLMPGFEVFAMFRLGVSAPTEFTANPRQIGVGVKVYTPDDGLFKIGFGVAPMFDFSTRYGDLGNDFLIHVPILAQFDFVPWFGSYLQVAPNISFVTEFKIDITAGIGVQGRFP
jgi:hypothetical protein